MLHGVIEAWSTIDPHPVGDLLDHDYDHGIILINRNENYCYIVFNVSQ